MSLTYGGGARWHPQEAADARVQPNGFRTVRARSLSFNLVRCRATGRLAKTVTRAQVSESSTTGNWCDTHTCIPNFPNARGSIARCNDGSWSQSGGISAAAGADAIASTRATFGTDRWIHLHLG